MAQLHVALSAGLDRATLDGAHALLVDVFEGELTEHDWEHALGGVHALMWDGGALMEALEHVIRGAYDLGALAPPTRPRACTPRAGGGCGAGRARRSRRRASSRRRTGRGASTSCHTPSSWICAGICAATGATVTCGDAGAG